MEELKYNKTLRELSNEYEDAFKFFNLPIFREFQMDNESKRTFKTETIFIYQKTGLEKNNIFYSFDTPENTYYKLKGKTWDDYDRQQTVILDNFDGFIEFDVLKNLCDRYDYTVHTKVHLREFTSKYLFIFSKILPYEWRYSLNRLPELYWRIDTIINFIDKNNYLEYNSWDEFIEKSNCNNNLI